MHGCRQELAAALLRMRRERPEQWAFFAPYWASLPGPGSVSSKYLISDEQVELMQVAGMVRSSSLPFISLISVD
jgi:hypothetical protein